MFSEQTIMKNLVILIFSALFLSGCYHQSLTLMGPATGATQGKLMQSSMSTAVSRVADHTIKSKTGKSAIEHLIASKKQEVFNKVSIIQEKVILSSEKIKAFEPTKQNINTIEEKIVLNINTISEKTFSNRPRWSYGLNRKVR